MSTLGRVRGLRGWVHKTAAESHLAQGCAGVQHLNCGFAMLRPTKTHPSLHRGPSKRCHGERVIQCTVGNPETSAVQLVFSCQFGLPASSARDERTVELQRTIMMRSIRLAWAVTSNMNTSITHSLCISPSELGADGKTFCPRGSAFTPADPILGRFCYN